MSNEIKCPQCGEAFTVDESGYAAILNQVRDQEFQREVDARVSLAEKSREQEVALAVSKAEEALRAQIAERDGELVNLKAQLSTKESEAEAARKLAVSDAMAAEAAARRSAGRVQHFQRLDGRKGNATAHDPQVAKGKVDLAHDPFGHPVAAVLVVAAAHHVPADEVRDNPVQRPGLVVSQRPTRLRHHFLCMNEIVVAAQRREGHELAGTIRVRPPNVGRHRRIQGRLGLPPLRPCIGDRPANGAAANGDPLVRNTRTADLLPYESREQIHFPSHGALPPWCSARDRAHAPSSSCP